MHQSSILNFFGSNSSIKDTDKAQSKVVETKSSRPQKIRKAALESDSDSNEPVLQKKIKLDDIKPSEIFEHKENEKYSKVEEIKLNNKESDVEELSDYVKIAPIDYDPMKSDYHIVRDACWDANQKVPYLALTKTFEVIESTSKRLEITRILSNFLRSVICLTPGDLLPCVYLCLNKVMPNYKGLEFGVGDTVIINALAESTGVPKNKIKSKRQTDGDLGLVAFGLPGNQQFLVKPQKLTVSGVFQKLTEISYMSGKSAQTSKVNIIKNMLYPCSKYERKYLVRSLLDKLRIGLAEQTVLAALGQAITLTPPNEPAKASKKALDIEAMKPSIDKNTAIIKSAICEYPSYDRLIESILKYGVSNLSNYCSICPGIPVKPMLAHPSTGVTEIFQRFDETDFTSEYKYDGERAQIHVSIDDHGNQKVEIFSRNQENNTTKFPDIVMRIQEMLADSSVKTCIIDSEAVAWDRENKSILPFQVLSTRKRKDVNMDDIKIQVCIYAFDLLYLNGQSLVREAFRERRKLLKEHFPEKLGLFMLATSLDSGNTDEISEFLEQSIRDKCEGLMIKTLDKDATYEISKRSHKWLKLKKDYLDKIGDTVDLVVIGASYGTGKRANKYGTFLLACYDPESEFFQTICNLGTGFSDEDLDRFYTELKETVIKKPELSYSYANSLHPDCWFDPKFVWEIKAADLSISPDHRAAIGLVDKDKGISLRFPRFVRVREDKTPEDATTSEQIAEMYRSQSIMKTNGKPKNTYEDEDFY